MPVYRSIRSTYRYDSARSTNGYRRFSLRLHQFPAAYKDELFEPCLKLQDQSPNLVLYDRSRSAVIELPYPVTVGGRRIVPSGIRTYFERRRQAFECWCGILTDTPSYLNITSSGVGTVGRCIECGTNISFDEKYSTATLVSDYKLLNRNGPVQPAKPISSPPDIPRPMVPYGGTANVNDGRHRPFYYGKTQRQRMLSPILEPSPSPDLPSPRKLLDGTFRQHRHRDQSPSGFLSLASPSSSTAEGLMAGPNSSAGPRFAGPSSSRMRDNATGNGPGDRLQFCDACNAAWPVKEFAIHVCKP